MSRLDSSLLIGEGPALMLSVALNQVHRGLHPDVETALQCLALQYSRAAEARASESLRKTLAGINDTHMAALEASRGRNER